MSLQLVTPTKVKKMNGTSKEELPAYENQAALVSIKAPPFMETASAAWFLILEAQFHLRHVISSEIKFYHSLAALPAETIARIPSSILSKHEYGELKEAVISLSERTKPELFEQLISSSTMSGRPSIFLDDIHRTANKVGVGEELVRHKFIQALPPSIAPVLAAQKDLSLIQVGKLADELMPLALQANAFVASSSNPTRNVGSQNFRSEQRPRVFSSAVSRGLQPFFEGQRPSVCRAHIFYGNQARTCRPWCQWPSKQNCRIDPPSRPSSPMTTSEN